MDTKIRAASSLHTLIPLEDFKALLNVDDREDKLARFCLISSTYSIEHYCKRRLLLSMSRERISMSNEQLAMRNEDPVCYLREYPVRKVLTAYSMRKERISMSNEQLGMSNEDPVCYLREYPVRKVMAVYAISNEQLGMSNGEKIESEFYHTVPDCGVEEDLPFSLVLSPVLFRGRGLSAVRVMYKAGYAPNAVPPDLASACLELAGWSLNRYRGKEIGRVPSIPEGVRQLLEPYKRRGI